MKVRFPLSVKVAVWLVLNLLLLGAAAVVFMVGRGGIGWDALVAGTAGDRLQALGNVVAGEVAASNPGARDAVLKRFGSVYDAEFVLLENRGSVLAGRGVDIPQQVLHRIDERPPGMRMMSGRPDFRGPEPEPDQVPGLRRISHGGPRGRFVAHVDEPHGWWIGLRVPFVSSTQRPGPATLMIRVESFGGLVRLLNLETWLVVAASVVVLSILFWLPLVHSITHHLRALTTATERIAEGRFETRVATHRRDELGRLGESVNTMASRLDALVNGQRRFLGDIAHELASPIARLNVATDILELRADPALRQQVADVREEVQHMANLVNELLAFTKAGVRADVTLVPVAIEPLLTGVLVREDPDAHVERHIASGLSALGDPQLLARAVGNLVRNALGHAGDSGAITLTARRESGEVVITVEDEGPGVPAPSLERLGEPFYRPEVARTRETGGMGLGLAIVRNSIAACRGRVRFANRIPHGFSAELRLAEAEAPADGQAFTRA